MSELFITEQTQLEQHTVLFEGSHCSLSALSVP
jgi:hypothetical protein